MMQTSAGRKDAPQRTALAGYFEHVELEMMIKAGLTPMQTLVAATGGAAKIMKLDQ